MSLFENPVARVKRISEEIKVLEHKLEHSRLSLAELRHVQEQRAGLIKTLDVLEQRTRRPDALSAMR